MDSKRLLFAFTLIPFTPTFSAAIISLSESPIIKDWLISTLYLAIAFSNKMDPGFLHKHFEISE